MNGTHPDNKTKLFNKGNTITTPPDINAVTFSNINIGTTTPNATINPGLGNNVITRDHKATDVAAPYGLKTDTPHNVDINKIYREKLPITTIQATGAIPKVKKKY